MANSAARVLVIAGSDSGGGAGIQGDIKTITCLGGYASTALTALTAQNTTGVYAIHEVPDAFIAQQIELVLDDIGADSIKTGMLHKISIIETVAAAISACDKTTPLILDPVMFAKGGAALLQPDALDCLKSLLIPRAALITPNIPEAEFLSEIKIKTTSDMQKAAEKILKLGCRNVLLKGGHLEGDELVDVLLGEASMLSFTSERISTLHTHGTGCTLASAIATGYAQGLPLKKNIERSRDYVRSAILHAPRLGSGHGPLMHNYKLLES